MRLISHSCSNTEIVCALGAATLLVGCDEHSDYPPEIVADLPRVGPDQRLDIQKLAALKPDLVIASNTIPGHAETIRDLERAGIAHVVIEPLALEDIPDNIRTIGSAIGFEQAAEQLAARVESELDVPLTRIGSSPRILVEWWPKPVIVPGRHSWVTGLLGRAAAVNPLGEEPVKSRPLATNEVFSLAPDAIVISWCGVPFSKYRPDIVKNRWPNLDAVMKEQIFCISEEYLGRPGPRIVEGLKQLRAISNHIA